jgi:hypothetical protein
MVRARWPGWLLGLLVGFNSPAAAQERSPPPRVELRENYPNPFTGSTTIPFTISQEVCAKGHHPVVSLKIYNVLAQAVAIPTLKSSTGEILDQLRLNCGDHEAFWDGRFSDGKRDVTPGVYYYQLIVDGQRYTRKMIARKQ